MKGGWNFRRFNYNMELIPACLCSYIKACLPILSLVLGKQVA